MDDERRLTEFLFRLRQSEPGYYEKITDTIRLIFLQFGDFLFCDENGMRTLLWTDTRARGHAFGLSVLSGGTVRVINLAVLLLHPTPSQLILIDKPEFGLHSFAIAVLAVLMKFAGRNVQMNIFGGNP